MLISELLICHHKGLTFNAGKSVPDSGKHYFAVYFIKALDEKKAPRATWAEHKGDPEGTKRLYIDFKKVFASAYCQICSIHVSVSIVGGC
ncbi:hypothetical protein OESDEN_13483 [Oesophagostomum dentatum]|uniref:Uncharacterized protein n=1 Tax=Oesophagostomum dentatum TaxID=61180 RepID=A0A0B1SS91_OESDE|nr:hypothetical protein OESDEN_13483 [Oesophagostomum dentatum]